MPKCHRRHRQIILEVVVMTKLDVIARVRGKELVEEAADWGRVHEVSLQNAKRQAGPAMFYLGEISNSDTNFAHGLFEIAYYLGRTGK